MKTIKVSIQDENTLVLQEDAQKGDLIDLKSIHETDIDKSTIASVVSSIKSEEFNARLQKEIKSIEREKELEAQLKEQRIIDRSKNDIYKKDQEIAELNSKLEAKIETTETEKKLAINEAVNKIERERDDLRAKLEQAATEKELAVNGAVNVIEKERDELISKLREKDDEVKLVESQTKNVLQEDISKKDAEIATLQQKLIAKDTEKQFAINEAIGKAEKERDELTAKLREKEDEAKLIESQTRNTIQEDLSNKNSEIATLQAKLDAKETEKRLAVTEAINKIERERDEMAGKLESKDSEKQLLEITLKDKYETELKSKDEMILYYKDLKAKLSTKMLGETLEKHCENSFRQWQSNGTFRNVYFQKDNDTSIDGKKGDYVYRETDENDNEILSIMFDMKNEADETITKKRNEDHFKKLNKDRLDKKCEYAILVSTLEADSELYTGITDVSYNFDKMYVIRPQFFISIIAILRNAALNSMKYKAELALVREQNIDITNFEGELQIFQEGFMKNVKDSGSKFQEAMDGIDSTIKKLEGIKEALRLSNKHLLIAGNKIENVSVKRLTKNNPTMAEKFADIEKNRNDK